MQENAQNINLKIIKIKSINNLCFVIHLSIFNFFLSKTEIGNPRKATENANGVINLWQLIMSLSVLLFGSYFSKSIFLLLIVFDNSTEMYIYFEIRRKIIIDFVLLVLMLT